MNDEQVANAAASAFSQLALYVMAVGKKYGEQEAFDLLASTFDQYGTQVGSMMKQQLEGQESDAQGIFGVLTPLHDSVGFDLQVVESTPNKVTMKISRCPLHDGCQAVGMPHEQICQYLARPFMNSITGAINPDSEWIDTKHRTSADDFCLEEIIIH